MSEITFEVLQRPSTIYQKSMQNSSSNKNCFFLPFGIGVPGEWGVLGSGVLGGSGGATKGVSSRMALAGKEEAYKERRYAERANGRQAGAEGEEAPKILPLGA